MYFQALLDIFMKKKLAPVAPSQASQSKEVNIARGSLQVIPTLFFKSCHKKSIIIFNQQIKWFPIQQFNSIHLLDVRKHSDILPMWKCRNVISPRLLLLFLITRSLSRDESIAEVHGAPEIGQLPKAWTRGRRETESCQRGSAAKNP